MSGSDPAVTELRARVARLEVGAWLERAVLLLLLYFAWDEMLVLLKLFGTATVVLLFVFAGVERIRARRA